MARKRKNLGLGRLEPASLQGLVYRSGLTETQKLIAGVGAILFGYAVSKYAPNLAGRVIPLLVSAFTPEGTQALPYHPEAAEPRTPIDERQFGRSEVVRAVSWPWKN